MSIEEYIVVALFGLLVSCITPAEAKTLAVAEQADISIALTDEPCALEAVRNLPLRATWTEHGEVIEGCYGIHPAGVIIAYWADRTISLAPTSMFERARTVKSRLGVLM